MKRSEMIKVIFDAQTNWCKAMSTYVSLSECDLVDKPNLQEFILSAIEETGMLPPPIKPKIDDYDTPEEFWIASDYHSRLLEDERFNWESEAECPFCTSPCGEKHCTYTGENND